MCIANVFSKLQTVENFDRSPCKNPRFGTRCDIQHVEVSQNLAKSPWELFYHFFYHSDRSWFGKCLPDYSLKSLGVFLNTLTADGKYPVEDWENLQLPMQIKLSEKRKTFSNFFFFSFLESTSNLKYLEIKDDAHS